MTILIIEDDRSLALELKETLESEHYRADVAFDGVAGMDMATAHQYDVIILDLTLPQHDGLEICSLLRAQNVYSSILILTARSDVQQRISGLDNGADDYLVKPFSVDELLARIRALLRRRRAVQSTDFRVGETVLDPKKHALVHNDTEIVLTPVEFSIMQYLFRFPETVLKTDQIKEHVWGPGEHFDSNVLSVHIRKIRKKVSTAGFPPLIHSVYGVGYKVSEATKEVER